VLQGGWRNDITSKRKFLPMMKAQPVSKGKFKGLLAIVDLA